MVKDMSRRQVTSGGSSDCTHLFKRANEIISLCAMQIAILLICPLEESFSLGNLDFDSIIEKILNQVKDSHTVYNTNNNLFSVMTIVMIKRDFNFHQLSIEKKNKIKDALKEKMLKSLVKLQMEMEAPLTLMLMSRQKHEVEEEDCVSSISEL
ncbi:Agamous-like MADS-box protein AGL29 [Linum perenne]